MPTPLSWRGVLRHVALLCTAGLGAGAAPPQAVLDRWSFEDGPSSEVRLANELREISGLAVGPDGRLFAHADESGEVHELDPATGRRIGQFGPGRSPISGDFEGLAWADGHFFMITSEGTIAEFPLAPDGGRAEYRRHVTGLARVCEVEGLAHDVRTAALLIACKGMREGGPPGIYAFDLASRTLELRPRHAVRTLSGDPVEPSGIVVDPATGHMVLVAARQRLVLELDREGRTVAERSLRRQAHPQAEGIELLADGTLLISDEGAGSRGRLAWYQPSAASQ